jgi:hypothetical protein
MTGSVRVGIAQKTGRVTVSYKITSPITLHEPVIVAFSIKNGLDEQVKFDLGHNRKSKFLFAITQPNGSVVNPPPLSEEGIGRIGRLSLGPGENYSQELVLNEWYDFNQPGGYQVEIRLADPIQTTGGGKLAAPTKQVLNLSIEPRDPAVLQARCAKLVKTVEESLEKTTDAALALSYVKDPIAVPYLKRLLKPGRHTEGIAIGGLGRIATDEAIEIIIAAAQDQNQYLAEYAKSMLGQIKDSVQNPFLRERIRSIIQD